MFVFRNAVGMMMSNSRLHLGPALGRSLAVLAMLLVGSPAAAQAPGVSTPTPAAAPPQASAPPPGYWALIGGYERDTHGSSYGFFGPAYVGPIRSDLAWTARAFGNYLTYEFSGLATTTRVRSPGANAAIGLQFGEGSTFGVSAGPAVGWRRQTVTSATGVVTTLNETRWGVNVGADAYLNPTSHNNIQAIFNYNTTDKYIWSRIGFKEQVSNRTWSGPTAVSIGVEAIGQGNSDIRSQQIGGLFEINHSPAKLSVMFRAGYKRSTFEVGSAKTGVYFGIGFYKRLN